MLAAGPERQVGSSAGTTIIRVLVPTWAEALPLLRYSPRVTGVGRQRYELAGCRAVLLAGFAGACQTHLKPGDVVLWGDVPAELQRLRGQLRTVDRIASPADKAALGADGVAAVDMETRWVEQAARKAELPFVSVRVIIDRARDRAIGMASAWHYPAASRSLRRAVRQLLLLWPDS